MVLRDRDSTKHTLIVAEIGNNHEGQVGLAKTLIEKAATSGVDAVKFQTFQTDHYISQCEPVRYEQLKRFELPKDQWENLAQLAHSLGLLFLSTPFDLESVAILEPWVDAYKIASGDNTFYPLIERVAKTGKPIIISTGASPLEQIERALSFVQKTWEAHRVKGQLAILHCVSHYPVPLEQANLRSISVLREHFDVTVGYSDHTQGIEAAALSVALGAEIIEKHFTLDHAFSSFRDHQLSATPEEMQELVRRVHEASVMLGYYEKGIQPCEREATRQLRRSIVATQELLPGHRLSSADLTWVRPAGGLVPGQEDLLLGRILKRSIQRGELLSISDVA